jgi:hypothetical protein
MRCRNTARVAEVLWLRRATAATFDWFLTAHRPLPDEDRTMTIRDPELLRQWRDSGYAVLKRAVPLDLIDRTNKDVAAFRANCGETKDDHGFGQRIGLFHIQNENSLQVALNPTVREFLAFALQDEPLLYGSLTFETGTEQAAHQDSIFFFTDPVDAMAGVWPAPRRFGRRAPICTHACRN